MNKDYANSQIPSSDPELIEVRKAEIVKPVLAFKDVKIRKAFMYGGSWWIKDSNRTAISCRNLWCAGFNPNDPVTDVGTPVIIIE